VHCRTGRHLLLRRGGLLSLEEVTKLLQGLPGQVKHFVNEATVMRGRLPLGGSRHDLWGRSRYLNEAFQGIYMVEILPLELPGGTNHRGRLVCQLLMGFASRGLGLEKGVKATTDVEFGF
jgi:hypothetical protein